MADLLSPFQRAVLEGFFRRAPGFYLTGGAALAGFHLGHRRTEDLDLFTTEDVLDTGELALQEVATELGANLTRLQTSPDFRRRLLRREAEGLVVDLVRERAAGGQRPKLVQGGVRLDSPEEIFANKLCALLSRSELRDLVDVRALEETGVQLEPALHEAAAKDASVTPGQLAWVLSQVTIGDDARIPGGGNATELRAYLSQLVARLSRLAAPR